MKTRILLLLLASLALIVPTAPSWSDPAAKPVTIRYADLGINTANLYQYLAIEHGIYKKHGVDLQIINFLKGGPEVIAATASGQLDLGSIGTPILIGISRGIPIKVVGSPPLKGQEFVLVGQPNTTSIAELKGKTLGVGSVGGGQSQALRFILRANGLSEDTVKVIAYGSTSAGYISLKSGQLAAAILREPEVSRVELEGSGKVLAEAADYYGRYQHSYVFATNKFIAEHPDAIRSFFRANREAIVYAKAHRDELVAHGQKVLNLDPAVLNKVFDKSIPKWDETQAVDIEGLLNAVKIVQELGDINKSYTPVVDQIIDNRFAATDE